MTTTILPTRNEAWGFWGTVSRIENDPAIDVAKAIIELKTGLGDPQALVGVMDRRIRLATRIASERGWVPSTSGTS